MGSTLAACRAGMPISFCRVIARASARSCRKDMDGNPDLADTWHQELNANRTMTQPTRWPPKESCTLHIAVVDLHTCIVEDKWPNPN
jgi:hypothetical protein